MGNLTGRIASSWRARRAPAYAPPGSVHRSFPEGPVLVVGDSHTWMAGAGKQYPGWDTDCRAGRTTAEGVEVVAAALAPRHEIVVFDAATNDDEVPPDVHWGQLHDLRGAIGERQLVLVSSWRLDKSLQHVLDNQRRLAAEAPATTSVADWGDFVASHPALFVDDRVHFTEAGLLVRTAIVWAGVRAAELRVGRRADSP